MIDRPARTIKSQSDTPADLRLDDLQVVAHLGARDHECSGSAFRIGSHLTAERHESRI
jgi:hypothetical protein